jgi:hypothetical protein
MAGVAQRRLEGAQAVAAADVTGVFDKSDKVHDSPSMGR